MEYHMIISRLLKIRGVSLRQFAAGAEISQQTAHDLKTGAKEPHQSTKQKVAEFFQVPVEEIFPEKAAPASRHEIEKLKAEISSETKYYWPTIDPFFQVIQKAVSNMVPLMQIEQLSTSDRQELEEFYFQEIQAQMRAMAERAAEAAGWREKTIKAEATVDALNQEIARLHDTLGKLIPRGFEMRPESEAAPAKKVAKG